MRTLVNVLASAVALSAIAAFWLLAPRPPSEAEIGIAGQPVEIETEVGAVTAFFDHEGAALRLTVLFDDPLDEEERLIRTTIRMIDGQHFSLILGHDGETTGRRYTFLRKGMAVGVKAEDYPQPSFLRELVPARDPSIEMAKRLGDAG
ncbi:MAG: hypothetical protein AAGI13_14555 [Pseudomonadota bacterium]